MRMREQGVEMSQQRAVCLLSGGPDSVVAAALARDAGFELYGLYVDYGQRTAARERTQAEATAKWLNVRELRTAQLPFLGQVGGSAVTDDSVRITNETRQLEYVPFRNTVFNSLAIAWAEVLDASRVVIGSIGGPWITPDNSPTYFEALNALVAEGSRSTIEVWAPLGHMTKKEVISTGLDLSVPFRLTWSCQNDADVPCFECNNCLDRAQAFEALKAVDPLCLRGPK